MNGETGRYDRMVWPSEVGTWYIELGEGEVMLNPASTKTDIYGPQRLLFTRHPDRGISVTLLPSEGPAPTTMEATQ